MTEWYILTGMGATSEMYRSLRNELNFNAHFLNWPRYKNENSFRRVAEGIIEKHAIGQNDVVGGSSVGGMVALEIAVLLNTKAIVLMGSAVAPNEINACLSMMSPLASIAPFSFIQKLAGKKKGLVHQMYAASNTKFIRAMCKYVSVWPGHQGRSDKIYRIHGQKDRVITCPQSNCDVLQDAGHLLAITHAKACARFLEKVKARLSGDLK